MILSILLTSYNRPALVRRTLESLIRQTCDRWRCYVLDDDSNMETWGVYQEFEDPRIEIIAHDTAEEVRRTTTRYSVLINEMLPELKEGVVGYLCDNVEYHPRLVELVLYWFWRNPQHYAGYVEHMRDVWTVDGSKRLGTAAEFGHWNALPPVNGPIRTPDGWLDHSQVFHRLPADLAWNEDFAVVKRGDGDFFTRLVEKHGPIQPIYAHEFLTIEHLPEGK